MAGQGDPAKVRPAWQAVLAGTGAFLRGGGPRYDLRPVWRARGCRRRAGLPEPLVRAHAFAAVLDEAPLHLYDGEAIVGSKASFVLDALPPDVSPAEFEALSGEWRSRGQRDFTAGFDHTLADYRTLLAEGVGGALRRVGRRREQPCAPEQTVFLDALTVTLEAFGRFIRRHADAVRRAGRGHSAAMIEPLATDPPRTFHEALLLVWLTHIAFVSEGRCHNALGRIDQYLYPFYRDDLAAGRLTREGALDLLCHLWAKIHELGEVTNLCIGGLTPEGTDGTNELSFLCLEATQWVRSPHANLSARFHDGTPDAFHRACFECIRTGVGFPAIFNDHVLIPGLVEIGIPPAIARDHCMVGCIETMLAGRQPPWSDSRFNTPQFLLKAMARMREEGERSFERLWALFVEEVSEGIARHAEWINGHIARFPPERFPDPFLSALTRDCIDRARDVNDGGAQFPRMHGIAVMGLATLADSLAAVRRCVFETGEIAYDDLMDALDANFQGAEPLRRHLLHGAPKYGNDESEVDELAERIVPLLAEECLKHAVHGGGWFVSAMAANVQNISAGTQVGATPDGRESAAPLSDAASPYFGRDRKGPTALLQSVSRPDYHRVLTGSVINLRFDPDWFQDAQAATRFGALTRFFVERRIPELQFNFTSDRVLLDAREHPENYADLVVRVSGFSAYYTRLDPVVQDDILRRRAHRL